MLLGLPTEYFRKRLHFADFHIEFDWRQCCDNWFPDETNECQINLITVVEGHQTSGPDQDGRWYPALNGEYKCLDGTPPSWMLQDGYRDAYIFRSKAACCKAHWCEPQRDLFPWVIHESIRIWIPFVTRAKEITRVLACSLTLCNSIPFHIYESHSIYISHCNWANIPAMVLTAQCIVKLHIVFCEDSRRPRKYKPTRGYIY